MSYDPVPPSPSSDAAPPDPTTPVVKPGNVDLTPGEKSSKVEFTKLASHGLAGTIAEVLESPASHYDEPDYQLLKFHGSYQQDDRDLRVERKRAKLDKAWSFMVRAKIPGGVVTQAQYAALDDICGRYTNGSLRVTSRQGIQYHGVGKEHLRGLIKAVNASRLSTLGACGDVNRNVMCCGMAETDWRAGLGMQELAAKFAEHFAPRSTAYWEIWCDGEKMGQKVIPNREEPIYGAVYLPRKFKIAVAVPEDNCVDLYSQDLGVEVVHEHGKLIAYDLLVGGGMGFSHGSPDTYPRLGTRLVRVTPEEVVEVTETIVKIQRDYGGREDRRHARLKYLMDDRGPEWFKQELFARLGRTLPDAGPMPTYGMETHLGWGESPDGTLQCGVHITNGRIADWNGLKLRTGMREIVAQYATQGVRLTPKQDAVLLGVRKEDKDAVTAALAEAGFRTEAQTTPLRRLPMACPALPTCGLALTESERYIPTLLDALEAKGWADTTLDIRMTGCPNSCVRTTMAEIGISGRGPGKYAMHLGGSILGTRLGYLYNEKVEETDLPDVIDGLLRAWDKDTQRRETFGDWSAALGAEAVNAKLAGA